MLFRQRRELRAAKFKRRIFLIGAGAFTGLVIASPLLRPGFTQPQAPDRDLSTMTYNIHHGVGEDNRLDLERIAAVIRESGAEMIGLQEVDRHWSARSNFVDQAEALAQLLNMQVVFAANLDRDPLQPGQPRRQYGTAILSKYPILESNNTLLPRPEGGEQRGLLEALINVRGVPVRVYNTHLQHNSQLERTVQVQAILDRIGQFEEPTILLGDLNALPESRELAPLYQQFKDTWRATGNGPGFTYSASNPDRRIDYILVSPEIEIEDVQVIPTLASDHLPVLAELDLPGSEVGVEEK